MPLAEALACANRADENPLHCDLHQPGADHQALEKLAEWCLRFSPQVCIEEAEEPESLFLDASNSLWLPGGEPALAERVVSELLARELWTRAVLADTVGGAWALCRYLDGTATPPRAYRSHPDPAYLPELALTTWRVVSSEELGGLLRLLPLAALRLPEEMVRKLARLGLHRVGQLDTLPREQLPARFGPLLPARWDQALGRQTELLNAQPVALPLAASWAFEPPVAQQSILLLALERLLASLLRQLPADQGLCRLTATFFTEYTDGLHDEENPARADRAYPSHQAEIPKQPKAIILHPMQPTREPKILLQWLSLRLERLSVGLVNKLLLEGQADVLGQRQEELWPTAHDDRPLLHLLDVLRGKLGEHAVTQAQLTADPRPEAASQHAPVSPHQPNRLVGSNNKGQPAVPGNGQFMGAAFSGAALPTRPLRLLKEPVPLSAVLTPGIGLPARFFWKGQPQVVARMWGPERLDFGWWQAARAVTRDYYRVETPQGSQFWIFQQHGSDRWFLHGCFD